jgi:hypothetical protein
MEVRRNMNLSRTMVIGWLTLAAAALAIPQITALIPEAALPFITVLAGALTLLIRWLSGQLSGPWGVTALTAVGLSQLVIGFLSMPELIQVIPNRWLPYVTGLTAILTLVTRWQSGLVVGSPDSKVGVLLRVKS